MKRRVFVKGCAAGAVTLVTPFGIVRAFPRNADTDLAESFRNPPGSAGPYTWWHWMNGNVTSDGLTRDLEAMKRVGVAGFQIFDVGTARSWKSTAERSSPDATVMSCARLDTVEFG